MYKNGRPDWRILRRRRALDFRRGDKRNSWSYNYGPATLQVLPNGLWTYEFPAGSTFDQANAGLYATLRPGHRRHGAVAETPNTTKSIPAYTIAQQPLLTQAPQITFSPADQGNRGAHRQAGLVLRAAGRRSRSSSASRPASTCATPPARAGAATAAMCRKPQSAAPWPAWLRAGGDRAADRQSSAAPSSAARIRPARWARAATSAPRLRAEHHPRQHLVRPDFPDAAAVPGHHRAVDDRQPRRLQFFNGAKDRSPA
jgi:hypothetical protein